MSKRVLGTKILARELTKKTLDSGIVMPDTAGTEKTRFEVFAIGTEVRECTVGDVVYVPQQIGRSRPVMNYEGEELTVLDENNLVIVETND